MYLVGASHPHKADAQRLLEQEIAKDQRLVTSAEVLQEILHRYVAIKRPDAIQPTFDALLGIVDDVYHITLEDVGQAKNIVLSRQGLSARDALHLAVMQRCGVDQILSFDKGFDHYPGITRIC